MSRVGDAFVTSDGASSYPIDHGTPSFLQHAPVETPETTRELERLNQIASVKGWRSAIDEVQGNSPYVTDEFRLKALDLLHLTRDDVVLEVGASLGQFTVAVAKCAKHVYALEVVPGQAQFVAERCKQEGLTNVDVACGGDECRLPYRDGLFDVGILSLVIEWCASRVQGEPQSLAQERLLREIYRVLAPGGRFYLSTKNRFALGYLLGKPDEHAWGTPFASVLPRGLVELLLKLRGKPAPSGRLYSYSELRHLLQRIGFGTIDSYWAAPEMRFPEHQIATDAASIRTARRTLPLQEGQFRSTRLLMPFIPAAFVKYVTPGLLFLAKKN
jgi:SAM-dependent methyltransferase